MAHTMLEGLVLCCGLERPCLKRVIFSNQMHVLIFLRMVPISRTRRAHEASLPAGTCGTERGPEIPKLYDAVTAFLPRTPEACPRSSLNGAQQRPGSRYVRSYA
jgi:hypothetical protein